MLSWLRRTLSSSIGKKALMALTGLLLIGFLLVHFAGNLLLYAGDDGHAFTQYALAFESKPALLYAAEVLLTALFVVHIVLGIRVTLQNREARAERYRARASHGARTPGSATMIVTGLVLLLFLLVHVYDFRLTKDSGDELVGLVRARLSGGIGFLIYTLGVVALGLHLSHAFQSALRSLGVDHPRYDRLVRGASIALGVVLGLGFLSFPLVFFFGGTSS